MSILLAWELKDAGSVAGNDQPSKTEVMNVIGSMGFAPIDLDSLNQESKLQQV